MPSDEPTRPPAGRSPKDSAVARRGEQDAWGAFGLVVAGVLVWGLIGALVGRWTDSSVPVLLGLLVGMAGGLFLVWFRYGRT